MELLKKINFANGPNNIKRWTVSTNSSDKRDNAKHKITR